MQRHPTAPIVCFYASLLVGRSSSLHPQNNADRDRIEQRIKMDIRRITAEQVQKEKTNTGDTPRFADSMKRVLVGAAAVPRDDFFRAFAALGVPVDASDATGNNQVLLLYQQQKALPDNQFAAAEATSSSASIPQLQSMAEAVANCDYVNVVLTDHSGQRQQCIATAAALGQSRCRREWTQIDNVPGVDRKDVGKITSPVIHR
jgi:hypothetical protein